MNTSEELEIGQRSWSRSIQSIEKDGYREGVEAGRINALQEGFDFGYKFGFAFATNIGFSKAKERFGKRNSDASESEFSVKCVMCNSNDEFLDISLEDMKERQNELLKLSNN